MPKLPTKNWLYAAGTIWPILVKAAAERRTLYYSDIAPAIPTNDLSVGRALGPIQSYCLEMRLPPFTAIVVSISSNSPGDGFVAWDADDLEAGQRMVFDYDWSRRPNPFGNIGPTDTIESLSERLVLDPTESEAVLRRVPDRGIAQRVFRAALMEAYDGKCAFCGTSFDSALEAAHIMPWSKASHALRLDVRNGLLLCATHHRLFDGSLMTVSEDYVIKYYDPDEIDGVYESSDAALSTAYHGQKSRLPADAKLHPHKHLLITRVLRAME